MANLIMQGKVNLQLIATCSNCKRTAFAERRMNITFYSIADIERTLNSTVMPNEIPVGWSSYGIGVYRCEHCTKV